MNSFTGVREIYDNFGLLCDPCVNESKQLHVNAMSGQNQTWCFLLTNIFLSRMAENLSMFVVADFDRMLQCRAALWSKLRLHELKRRRNSFAFVYWIYLVPLIMDVPDQFVMLGQIRHRWSFWHSSRHPTGHPTRHTTWQAAWHGVLVSECQKIKQTL